MVPKMGPKIADANTLELNHGGTSAKLTGERIFSLPKTSFVPVTLIDFKPTLHFFNKEKGGREKVVKRELS